MRYVGKVQVRYRVVCGRKKVHVNTTDVHEQQV